MSEVKASTQDREYEKTKPEDTDFRQQRLRAWQPLLTPRWVITTFLIIGVIFLPLGIGILVTSNDIVEITQRYDTIACDGGVSPCVKTLKLDIPEDMDAPIFFYYKLTNFYQNHRRYVKSRSDTQIAGEGGSTSTCDPLEDFEGKTMYPCGLIANSHFTDSYEAWYTPKDSSTPAEELENGAWDRSDIAWKSDREVKFKDLYDPVTSTPLPSSLTREAPTGPLPDLNNQDLMVWMRTAGLSTFRKLYSKIDKKLYKGDTLEIRVNDKFDVVSFGGTKSVVLSTVSWIGGKNNFLAYSYIAVGGFCLLFGFLFLLKQLIAPRPFGEMKSL